MFINLANPNISLVILLTVCDSILRVLFGRIRYWRDINNPLIDIFLYFHHLFAWYCIDVVRRNSVLVTHGSEMCNAKCTFWHLTFNTSFLKKISEGCKEVLFVLRWSDTCAPKFYKRLLSHTLLKTFFTPFLPQHAFPCCSFQATIPLIIVSSFRSTSIILTLIFTSSQVEKHSFSVLPSFDSSDFCCTRLEIQSKVRYIVLWLIQISDNNDNIFVDIKLLQLDGNSFDC